LKKYYITLPLYSLGISLLSSAIYNREI